MELLGIKMYFGLNFKIQLTDVTNVSIGTKENSVNGVNSPKFKESLACRLISVQNEWQHRATTDLPALCIIPGTLVC